MNLKKDVPALGSQFFAIDSFVPITTISSENTSARCPRLISAQVTNHIRKRNVVLIFSGYQRGTLARTQQQLDSSNSFVSRLYWGEVSLASSDYSGPTQQIRVIEHTVFLDDVSFEPLGGGQRSNDYVQRATRTEFETRGKVMYVSPDQLGMIT